MTAQLDLADAAKPDPKTCPCSSCAAWREMLARWEPVFRAVQNGEPYAHLLPPQLAPGSPGAVPSRRG